VDSNLVQVLLKEELLLLEELENSDRITLVLCKSSGSEFCSKINNYATLFGFGKEPELHNL